MTAESAPAPSSAQASPWPEPIPRGLGLGAALVSSLSGLAFIGLAVSAATGEVGFRPLPFALALIGLLSAALAGLTGLGRFRQGPAMALGILAGSILGSAGLARLLMLADAGALKGDVFLFGQAVAAALLAAVAAGAVMLRKPDEIKRLLVGAGLCLAAVLVLGLVLVGPGRGLLSAIEGPLEIARLMGLLAGALVLGVLISVGGHLVITAFERAGDSDPKADDGPRTGSEDT